jgi:hypothetical protein
MKAADFVLATLSHYVTRADAPPPGVPARVSPGFETAVSAICVDQGLSSIIARSLDSLALPPSLSSVTIERLRRDGVRTDSDSGRRMRSLVRLVDALSAQSIPVLVMGDARSAATLYGDTGERPVHRLELLVHETRVVEVLAAAAGAGFSRRRSDPSIDPTPTAPPTLRADRDLLEFHHYMTPLLLWNGDGDGVRIRFRAVDVGHPEVTETAFDRAVTVRVGGSELPCVSLEDHLADLAMRLGASRYGDLGAMTDIGLILRHHGDEIAWAEVVQAVRRHRIYSALRYVLGRVERVLGLGRTTPLEPPRRWVERWLDLFWKPDDTDYARGPGERNRFVFGLIACGGIMSKLRWVWRYSVPRRDWVERVVGDARSPWNWLTFQMIMRERLRPRRGALPRFRPGETDITRIDDKD